jgi:hypothetical protein
MARPFIFRCKATGLNVQGTIEGDPLPDDRNQYQAVACTACGRLHLVNMATLKLLSDENEGPDQG